MGARKRWLIYCAGCGFTTENYFGELMCIKEVVNRMVDGGWLVEERDRRGYHVTLCSACAEEFGTIESWRNHGISPD